MDKVHHQVTKKQICKPSYNMYIVITQLLKLLIVTVSNDLNFKLCSADICKKFILASWLDIAEDLVDAFHAMNPRTDAVIEPSRADISARSSLVLISFYIYQSAPRTIVPGEEN
uniref:Uncharacterized protein n=1 Tax=Glossina palpalis gambiensis TaxID=67801 RepID=A0A1B0B2C0_9MUSC